jgi:hypothetical protein
MSEAYKEEERIRQAMGESDASFASLTSEVDGLVRALETIARRAQKIDDYLAAQDRGRVERRLAEVQARPDDPACRQLADALGGQLQTMDRMSALLDRFEAEMENVVTTLRVMRGQLIQMSVAQAEYGEERLADQARALREQVGAAAESMEEVTSAAD